MKWTISTAGCVRTNDGYLRSNESCVRGWCLCRGIVFIKCWSTLGSRTIPGFPGVPLTGGPFKVEISPVHIVVVVIFGLPLCPTLEMVFTAKSQDTSRLDFTGIIQPET